MQLRTPKHGWMVWAIGIGLALAVIPLLLYSSDLYYAEGGTSPDGPGMLLASVFMTSPGWGTIWLTAIASYLLGYRGRAPVMVGIGDSFPSILLSMIAIMVTGLFLWLAFARVEFWKLSRLPFTTHPVGCAIYFQYLRAAAVARSRRAR